MHRRIRSTGAVSLLAMGVVGLLLVGGTSGTSTLPAADGVNVATPFTEREQFGTMELHTDPNGRLAIQLLLEGETQPEQYDLSPSRGDRCLIRQRGTDTRATVRYLDDFLDLEVVAVSFDADNALQRSSLNRPPIGLVDNGIGSREQNNCNRNNGRIEPGQGFVIDLGSDPRFRNVVFDYGVLDIEGKFGADLYGETYLNGTRTGTVYDTLGAASDNDADAGGSDNNRVHIGAPPASGLLGPAADDFDQLVILPVATRTDGTYFFDRGQLALEGGGDFGDGSNRTVFNLVTTETFEYTVVCESGTDVFAPNPDGTVKGIIETPEEPDWATILDDPNGTVDYPAEARLFRYRGFTTDPVSGERVPKPCPPIGVDLSADALRGVLLEPSDETAFLRLELTWIIPAALVDLADGEPLARTIDLDGDGPLAPQAARYCDSFDGANPFDPAAAGDAIHPADTPWCVLSDERELTKVQKLDENGNPVVDGNGDPVLVDVVIQRMVWDGLGDPYFR